MIIAVSHQMHCTLVSVCFQYCNDGRVPSSGFRFNYLFGGWGVFGWLVFICEVELFHWKIVIKTGRVLCGSLPARLVFIFVWAAPAKKDLFVMSMKPHLECLVSRCHRFELFQKIHLQCWGSYDSPKELKLHDDR